MEEKGDGKSDDALSLPKEDFSEGKLLGRLWLQRGVFQVLAKTKVFGAHFSVSLSSSPPKVTNGAVPPSHSRNGMGNGIEPWPLSHHAVPRIVWDQRGSLPLLVCPLSALGDRQEQKSSLAIPFPSRP